MSNWFCEYSWDGNLIMHMTLEAVDREDAEYQLIYDYGIGGSQILDLHEIPS